MPVVVGIFSNHDAIAKVVDGLKAGGLDLNELTVITDETPEDEGLATSGVQFVLSGGPDDEMLNSGSGIITTGGGTGVPGLTDTETQPHVSYEGSIFELLADLDIPDGRTDDYAMAIEQRRCVAGYVTSTDIDKVKGVFSGAGGNPVEVF